MNTQLRAEPAAVPPVPREERDAVAATVVRPTLPRFVLRGVSGAGFGRTFPLVGPTVLGRSPECGIRLDHPGISREHLRLTPTAEGLLVEDLGSTNGWVLNEVRQDRAWARHGDELGVDALRFRVVAPGAAPAPVDAGKASRTASLHRVPRWWWAAGAAVLGLLAVLLLR
ncbi:MAG TPA: FHA domain-containing protein [Luteimonas sp.]